LPNPPKDDLVEKIRNNVLKAKLESRA